MLGSRQVNLNLLADDVDPRDPSQLQHPVGGPTATKVFRFSVSFRGQNAAGRDTTIAPPDLDQLPSVAIPTYQIPVDIVGSAVDVIIELCDCRACRLAPGQGKCIIETISVVAPVAQASRTSVSPKSRRFGPGSSNDSRSVSP